MIVILNYTTDIEYYWRGYNRSSRIMLLILPSATTNTGNTLNNIRRYDRGVTGAHVGGEMYYMDIYIYKNYLYHL